MTDLFRRVLERIDASQNSEDPDLSDVQRRAIEFFGNADNSFDDVDEDTLAEFLAAIGEPAASELRSLACQLAGRELIDDGPDELSVSIESMAVEMRRRADQDETLQIAPFDAGILEIGISCLGLPLLDRLTPRQQLKLYECVGQAHRRLLRELADEALAREGEFKSMQSTVHASDQSTVWLARTQPAWVVHRDDRLESLQQLDPLQARVYLLGEYAQCDSGKIAAMMTDDLPDNCAPEDWTSQQVQIALDAARAYCSS